MASGLGIGSSKYFGKLSSYRTKAFNNCYARIENDRYLMLVDVIIYHILLIPFKIVALKVHSQICDHLIITAC